MRLLVNALSIGSLSGRHVLFGHVEQLAQSVQQNHEIVLLHQAAEDISRIARFANVESIAAPDNCNNWIWRSGWEAMALPRFMQQQKIDLYFSPSGSILLRSPVPQATLAQNPWCLVPGMTRTLTDKCKASVQRRAYRRAFRSADLMIYNSQHMRDLYQRNAPGHREKNHLIVYQGIDESTFTAAAALRNQHERRPLSILAVSVMARWKGIEVLVEALKHLHQQKLPASLTLVGPWADTAYRQEIEHQVSRLQLLEYVNFAGMATLTALHEHYARAQVFCLMSRCESFGIPAVEAQAFGTPVVGSNICAMEEICGAGGLCTSPDRPDIVADLLARLLTDPDHWKQMSSQAHINAQRYHWAECSKPLQALFQMGSSTAHPRTTPQPSGARVA